ncbi:ATP-binding protein [Patescibacteria group bacterium]|nr:ATP-binding protein [Patescibacteria group bacterium]MBU2259745.1 ATP-binding protein [Patescibacteria group bacterium]
MDLLDAEWRMGGLQGKALENALAELEKRREEADQPDATADKSRVITSAVRKQVDVVISHILDGVRHAHKIAEIGGDEERVIFAIHLSADEALTNAVMHGVEGDPSKLVRAHLIVSINEHRELVARLVIDDGGKGFNPESIPDPTAEDNLEETKGRGLLLMKRFMDQVRFNDAGNEVTLEKIVKPGPREEQVQEG